MVGIISCSGYVPLWRLNRNVIAPGLKGEKAIAGFDEDSITMAAAASVECLKNIDRDSIDALFFCTTTAPYSEKQHASILSKALDLRKGIFTADLLCCLRGGTIGLRMALDMVKAGSAKKVLVVAADTRLGAPESNIERDSADGAAACVVGESENLLAEIKGYYSVSNELMDVWRFSGEPFVNTEEDRFIEEEGYLKIVHETILELMNLQGMKPDDFAKAVFYIPNPRCHQALPGVTGFKVEQIQDPLFGRVGNTGTAHALMLMTCALEESKQGEKILMASYGDGSDAFILEVVGHEGNTGKKMASYIGQKKTVEDYRRYLKWRGILPLDKGRTTLIPKTSLKAMMRRQDEVLGMHGVKCRACGTVQYPPQRVCTNCHAKDQFDKVRLSDKKGQIYTWTADWAAGGLELPIPTMTDVEGGGRIFCILCDATQNEVRVGLPVEFTLRKSYSQGIPEYIWKVRPALAYE